MKIAPLAGALPTPPRHGTAATGGGPVDFSSARRIGEALQQLGGGTQFRVDEESGRVVLRIFDRETGELIRQVPAEELLSIARALDRLQGLLVREKV